MKDNYFPGNLLLRAFILLYLVSCATQSNIPRFSPVYLTDKASYYLLPAREIEKPLDCAQQITVNYDKQEFTLDAWVRADESGIEIALFTPMGISMGDFSFSDSGVSLDSPVFPPSFKAEYMAADFQLCYFHPEALRFALAEIGLSFEIFDNKNDDGMPFEIRRISESGKIIIEINKTGNEIQYTNLLRGYGYILREAD